MKFVIALFALCGFAVLAVPQAETEGTQRPVYQHQEYVPHKVYPNAETYPNPGYDFLVPAPYREEYMSALLPPPTTALQYGVQFLLKLLAKVGVVFAGGAALLVIGTLLTTLICSLTPFCTITFNGVNGVTNEALQAYMTPEKLEAAAALVQDAIGKYERMQRSTKS